MLPVSALKSAPTGTDSLLNGLDFLALELTEKCNLECVHCYAGSGPSLPLTRSMQVADWKRVIADSFESGCRKVQFIGGEPTIYPALPELIEYSRCLGYEFVEVFTNGTLFTERIRRTFAAFRVSLAFSVYAAEANVHDSVTLRQGSFVSTVNSIKWALSEALAVRVAIVQMTENAGHVPVTKAFIESLGVSEIRVDNSRGIGRGGIGKDISSPMSELCGNCWKGRLCVTPTGSVFPCVMSRSWQMGTASDGIKSILQGDRLLDFRTTLKLKTENQTTCGPQCGPDCSPAQCGPQCSP